MSTMARKYAYILNRLDEDALYSAGRIAQFADEHKLIFGTGKRQEKQRLRIAMLREARHHRFPVEGDGKIEYGGAPITAWFGWRWKQTLGNC